MRAEVRVVNHGSGMDDCTVVTTMPLHEAVVRPADRLMWDRATKREKLVASERFWQGSWVCNGYIITAFLDMAVTEEIAALGDSRHEERDWWKSV